MWTMKLIAYSKLSHFRNRFSESLLQMRHRLSELRARLR